MHHVATITKPRIPRRADVALKQSLDEKDPGYVLDLAFSLAEVFFLAKDSSGQKAQP